MLCSRGGVTMLARIGVMKALNPLSDIEPSFVYSVCGKRGAEVRPKFSRARSVSL